MPKSFHITNQSKAQQLDEANNGLWLFVKTVLCLIVLVFVFREPESVLAIDLPAISLPTLESHPNDNGGTYNNRNQFEKYPNGDPVCGGETLCFLGWRL
jgi:hypothetical protein